MAQVEASIMGGRLYLGAYAQRLGAAGLTFFDDDVTEFFSPHAEGKSVMFLVLIFRYLLTRVRGGLRIYQWENSGDPFQPYLERGFLRASTDFPRQWIPGQAG